MSPEELAAYREWIRISKFASNSWPCMALDHIDQQATQIAELDDAVSGPLENIAKMLETVNADTMFAGVIQTWKTENQTLKSQIAALKEIAVEGWAVAEFGGEQEGQDYHLYFRTWNIDRESYRKEARKLLQAEHPEAFR